ncbi:MAG: FtsW/RodA/SpoVE family cell cycle protein [Cytophagales bacterium]
MSNHINSWLKKNLGGDPVIWFVAISFGIISTLVVYSATGAIAQKKLAAGDTEYFLKKHIMFMLIGYGSMWLAHKIDYRYYSKISQLALWVSLPLLGLAFVSGTLNGAGRWLNVFGFSFQPSDLAKFALIANLASRLAKRQKEIDNLTTTFIPMVLWCGIICGAIALSNFSTAAMMFATCILLMFIGRVPFKYLGMLFLVGILIVGIALASGQRMGTAVSRIKKFLDKDEMPFQAQQARIAISLGGPLGLGPGKSISRNTMPHPYSDMVYPFIIEEYGILGGVVVLGLFLLLLYRGMITVQNSERAFGGLLSAGLTFMIVIQAMINMGVGVGLGPITGQPLPFISMGGTSLLFTGISLGIILSVSKGEGEESLQ